MVVQGVFSSRPPDPDAEFEGWEDEVSAVLECPVEAICDRITSEFPESIEQALQVAAETHSRSPLAPELPAEADAHRKS